MFEIYPLVSGIVIALIAQRLDDFHLRIVLLFTCSIVFGAIASFISGELFVSWAYLVFDVPQVLIAAGVTTALVAGWRRWLTQHE